MNTFIDKFQDYILLLRKESEDAYDDYEDYMEFVDIDEDPALDIYGNIIGGAEALFPDDGKRIDLSNKRIVYYGKIVLGKDEWS